jgi:hypothetical protein
MARVSPPEPRERPCPGAQICKTPSPSRLAARLAPFGSREGVAAARWVAAESEIVVMEPRGSRSIVQVVARQPGRYWRRRSPQVLRLLHSSYVGDAGNRAELNDRLGHEVRPSTEFPHRHCGRGPAKIKSLHNGRFPIESYRSR